MTGQEGNPERLAELIENGGVLEGFPWPEQASEFDIRIGRDGVWYHEGGPIRRLRLCRLFSTVLHRDEEGDFWLVTPGERGRIAVDDAPFLAVELRVGGDGGDGDDRILHFRTSLDHWIAAGSEHPIRVVEDPGTGEPSPYIVFRDRLDALISRAVFYELVDLAEAAVIDGHTVLAVRSGGVLFSLGTLPENWQGQDDG